MAKIIAILLLVIVTFANHANGATDVLNDASLGANLVAYWELEEASGTRVDSYASYDLTDNNTVTQCGVAAIQGDAALFERATSEYLDITSDLGLSATGDWSISYWIKQSTVPTGSAIQQYYSKSINSADDIFVAGDLSDFSTNDYLHLVYPTGDDFYLWNPGTSNWHHVVITYDYGGDMTWYTDGSSVKTTTYGSATTGFTADSFFVLGQYRDQSGGTLSRYLDACMDEVGIWSKVLTGDDVTALYNSGAGLPFNAGVSSATSTKPFLNKGGSVRVRGGIIKNTQ